MGRKKCDAARMALDVLRIALLWARRGRVVKKRLMLEIHLVSDYLKSLKHNPKASVHYREQEFSFDSSPMIQVKMYRPNATKFRMPHLPCLNPEIDYNDYKFESESEDADSEIGARISFLKGRDDRADTDSWEVREDNIVPYDDDIDARAEEFIARFYHQTKPQTQDLILSNVRI